MTFPFQLTITFTVNKVLLFSVLLFLSHGPVAEADNNIPRPEKPTMIGVPRRTFADVFVKIESQSSKNSVQVKYGGFCIDVFLEVAKILDLRHEFVAFNGSYNDLINCVANKTFDGAVGDITILADRWRLVDFSAPFAESGVSLVAQLKPETPNPLMFLTPFTMGMWVATGAILIYTMSIVWFLEHRSNPEFSGPWNDQLGNALWFTFTSVFFCQREKIHYNYTRVVVVVWLFVVLILTQSYGASFTSMLTVSRLQPSIEHLKRTNAKVGYFGIEYIGEFLEKVLQFKLKNIQEMKDLDDIISAYERGPGISTAFVETPYAKVLVKEYCKKYAIIGPTYRFGGFGFVFPKGSPMTDNVSEAIQRLLENGALNKLKDEYFTPSPECSNPQTTKTNDSLSLKNFWVLYIFSAGISTICLLLFIINLLKNYRYHRENQVGNMRASNESAWKKIVRLMQYLGSADTKLR